MGKTRAQDADRHVGARIRERRVMLGLTQNQMADLIGVTYQQAHKYEKAVNRVAASRLYEIAQVLGVDPNYFFEGLGSGRTSARSASQDRLMLDLAHNFAAIKNVRQQEAICDLARALAPNGSAQP